MFKKIGQFFKNLFRSIQKLYERYKNAINRLQPLIVAFLKQDISDEKKAELICKALLILLKAIFFKKKEEDLIVFANAEEEKMVCGMVDMVTKEK